MPHTTATNTQDTRIRFIEQLADALNRGIFLKLSLGAYSGSEAGLQKIQIRLVMLKTGLRAQLRYRYQTRDETKNILPEALAETVSSLLNAGFRSARIFTTEADWQLELSAKGSAKLSKSAPTQNDSPIQSHDRQKNRLIDQSSPWLMALGVTDKQGNIRERMAAKWTQINRFLEILDAHLNELPQPPISVLDMGCGKGYLTLAAAALLQTKVPACHVIGIEQRADLVTLCNKVATESGLTNARFEMGTIADAIIPAGAVVIALHACNTATDAAIARGLHANSPLIICSPCCHQELRPRLEIPDALKPILRHGILLERQAELLTDGLRALYLEASGYATKVIEFTPDEHTPKNLLITALRKESPEEKLRAARQQLDLLKTEWGIRQTALESICHS